MFGDLKIAWISLIAYSSCISVVKARSEPCVANYKVLNWEFEDPHSPPPAVITQNLRVSKDNQTNIEVWLRDRREDFNFTLFADPFVKNEADCPPRLQEHKNIRQFLETCPISKEHNESISRSFGSIFTGCYYFLMTNREGKNWQHGPLFYNTSYRYLDTKLELGKNNFQPEEINSKMKLKVVLKVPLSCIRVRVELFELKPGTRNALEDIKNWRIPESLTCYFQMIDREVKPDCKTSALITNLTLTEIKAEVKDDGWTGIMVWEELQRGGGNYYLHFVGDPTRTCTLIYGAGNIRTWRPIDGQIWEDLGLRNSSNLPPPDPASNNRPWFTTGFAIVGILLFAVSCYWAWKHRDIIRRVICKEKKKPVPDLVPEPGPEYCKESDQILLLYEKGSPEFMEKMRNFRDYLTKHCIGCSVHDVYAINAWNRVSELGAPEWVLELLEDGSKVVWVDTPQFRSRFIDKEKQYVSSDFRDNAVPYAVCIAREAFVNSITQYRRHFVVRVRGYEVEHDQDADPLKVVSPHARYYIPEHLSLLCEHLKGPMELLANGKNRGVESQVLQGVATEE